ncbi:ribbon-helix-helix domain-containing protein [bacterium]|nr:ribbon-helix-helix domain-containing protein [bacterium]
MLVQKKIQIDQKDWSSIEELVTTLNYKSKSEFMRQAILEKIRSDKKKIKELKRQSAMQNYFQDNLENIFEDIEGDGFEDR